MGCYVNHIIVLIGILTIILSFIIVFSKKERDFTEEYITDSSSINQEAASISSHLLQEGNNKILIEIKKLEEEVVYLRNVIQEIHILLEDNSKESNSALNNHESFKHLLNYNQFINKNKTIIDLFKQNKSSEEIAKLLNKSIREVDMVIKLIK